MPKAPRGGYVAASVAGVLWLLGWVSTTRPPGATRASGLESGGRRRARMRCCGQRGLTLHHRQPLRGPAAGPGCWPKAPPFATIAAVAWRRARNGSPILPRAFVRRSARLGNLCPQRGAHVPRVAAQRPARPFRRRLMASSPGRASHAGWVRFFCRSGDRLRGWPTTASSNQPAQADVRCRSARVQRYGRSPLFTGVRDSSPSPDRRAATPSFRPLKPVASTAPGRHPPAAAQ